jgi:hypothetical protein
MTDVVIAARPPAAGSEALMAEHTTMEKSDSFLNPRTHAFWMRLNFYDDFGQRYFKW